MDFRMVKNIREIFIILRLFKGFNCITRLKNYNIIRGGEIIQYNRQQC